MARLEGLFEGFTGRLRRPDLIKILFRDRLKKFDFFSGAYYKVSGSARDRPSDAFPIASDFFYFRLDYPKDNAVDIDVNRTGRLPAFTTTEAIGQNIDP